MKINSCEPKKQVLKSIPFSVISWNIRNIINNVSHWKKNTQSNGPQIKQGSPNYTEIVTNSKAADKRYHSGICNKAKWLYEGAS